MLWQVAQNSFSPLLSYFVALSGGFSVLQFSTIDLEKKLAELIMKLQRLRMKGGYKMFIDSLSERNKSKNAIKGFNPCIELSLLKETCYLILLLLNR